MKTDSNELAVFLDAAQGVKAHYHAPYAMPSLIAEAGTRAPKLKREAFRRTRNRVIAELAVVLIILAGCTIRIPASSSSALRRFAPDIKPNVWQALSIFALSGVKIDSQEELQQQLQAVAQVCYEKYAAKLSASRFETMALPIDIQESIGSNIDENIVNDLDPWRDRGMIGGYRITNLRLATDKAQYGWKPIREQLESIGGLPLNSPVKPYSECTPEEKALLAPSYSTQVYLGERSIDRTRNGEYAANLLCAVAANMPGHQITSTDLVDQWLGASAYEAMHDAAKAFSVEEADRWISKNFLVPVASPVTGKLFEPNHPEYSRGNGFIKEITDEGQIKQLVNAVIQAGVMIGDDDYARAPQDFDWNVFGGLRWIYFRLYGESEIIAEGVLFGYWSDQTEIGLIYHRVGLELANLIYHPVVNDSTQLRATLKARIAEAMEPAPDYEEWLAKQDQATLAAYVWQERARINLLFVSDFRKHLDTRPLDEIETLQHGMLADIFPEDVNGLPTEDPLAPINELSPKENQLIAGVLEGDKSPIAWFADTGVKRIHNGKELVRNLYAEDEMRILLRSVSVEHREFGREMRRKVMFPYKRVGVESLFLPIYRDFEPYQGYFERVDTPGLREKAQAQLGREPKDMIYFRIYGAERVIAEGLWVR